MWKKSERRIDLREAADSLMRDETSTARQREASVYVSSSAPPAPPTLRSFTLNDRRGRNSLFGSDAGVCAFYVHTRAHELLT
jgi:hypothetical protein